MSPKRIYDPIVEKYAADSPNWDVTDVPSLRQIAQDYAEYCTLPMPPRDTDPDIEEIEITIPGADGTPDIPIRIYMPNGRSEPGPSFVNFHGGGFLMGDLESEHINCMNMVRKAGCVAIGVDYRLAPEHPFPAGFDDCYQSYLWVLENAASLYIDPNRVIIGGSSAGGCLTAAVALKIRDTGITAPIFQMLYYPVIDDRCNSPSMQSGNDCYVWTQSNSKQMWDHYIGKNRSDVSAYAAPARATDLSNLPPAFIMTCEHDPLRDEAIFFAMDLMNAGTPVELHNYPGTTHSFDRMSPAPIARRAADDAIQAAIRALNPPPLLD
ncbi:MAG: alpha/beta hydrolase [Pseudoruegeria sp.]